LNKFIFEIWASLRMPTPGLDKSIAGTLFGNRDTLLGKRNFSDRRSAKPPRFDSGSASRGAHIPEPVRVGWENDVSRSTRPRSPQKPPGGDPEAGDSGGGGRAAVEEEAGIRYGKYWKKLKKITVVWMLAWTVPAIIMHLPIGATREVTILDGIPLHWFNAAFLAILIGIVLIFMYAYVMERTDRAFKGA
jgi:putative solute:sodium symporter small subunit